MGPIIPHAARAGRPARRLAADRRGVTAVLTALGLTLLLGFAGLAVDVGAWLNATRGLQAAADQSAYSAAVAAGASGCSSLAAYTQATAVAAARGYVNGQNTVVVSTTCNPSTAAFTVKISQNQPLWFTGLFLKSPPTASAYAIAQAAAKVSDLCVLALDGSNVEEGIVGSDSDVFWLNGNAAVNLHCGVAVDSTNASSLSTGGSSSLTATDIYLAGDDQGSPSGGSTITTSPIPNNILRNQTAIADPYSGRTIPSYSPCSSFSMTTFASSQTVGAGVYCGGLSLGGSAPSTLNLTGGLYFIVGGSLNISSKATVNGTNVTFILTGNQQAGYATATINGGANVSLSAPTGGPTGGMLFFQDRNAPFSGSASSSSSCGGGGGNTQNHINGGSGQYLTGAVYFPNQSLCFGGSSSTSGAGQCTQIIAHTISFTGTSDVQLSCAGTGVEPVTVPTPQLIK